MKISKLIKELQALEKQYGDLPVRRGYVLKEADVGVVHVYTEEGEFPECREDAVEVFLC